MSNKTFTIAEVSSNKPNVTLEVTTAGEANVGENVGTGASIYKTKDGTKLVFKTIEAGNNVTITEDADTITLSANDEVTAQQITEWATAYGWGNHADAGYLTSYTETDPVFSASPSAGITAEDITNWNTQAGYGDHSTEGYLTSLDIAGKADSSTTLSGYGISDAYTKTEVDTALGTKAAVVHNHDNIYYTETEVDAMLSDVVRTADLVNYWDKDETLNTTEINTAIDAAVDPVAASVSTNTTNITNLAVTVGGKADAVHTHDDRYYTETEIDSMLSGIATSGHTHDDRYYTETEMDVFLAGKAATAHTHNYNELLNKPTIPTVPTVVSAFSNDAGYITEQADLTPYSTTVEMNAAIAAAQPTGYNNTDWDTAFGWGDHSGAGYLTAHQDISGKANLTDVYTQTQVDNAISTATTGLASETYVDNSVASLVDAAPAALDTLNELAAALGDDPNFATTVNSNIAAKWTQDNAKIANWDAAYSWGNHATEGYLTAHQDISGKADSATTLAGYGITDAYTKTQIDTLESSISTARTNAINTATADMATQTWVAAQGYLTSHQDLTGYATESFVTSQGYLTAHQDISGKANVADVYTQAQVDALLADPGEY